MVMSNKSALGIIFPNIYDKLVPDLTSERLMASIPFGSRYRMIDFILSSMVNCGISNISILVRENYFSLLDHLGSGREWDLARKNGGLNIFPPFAQKSMSVYGGRIEAMAGILGFLKSQKEKYVVMSDANIAMNFDFRALIEAHIASGADITAAYKKEEIPEDTVTMREDSSKGTYYTFDMDGDRINGLHINSQKSGIQNFGMNIYVMERELLIDTINTAFISGGVYFERDILLPHLNDLKICGYEYTGYTSRILSLKGYFDENMKLLDDENLDALFSGHTIYTKIRDDNPTRYIGDAKASNVMVADGCVIEGEVENSILFRGVKIGKGAKVKNCILMQDTVVEDGVDIEYVITDKKVTITENKHLNGTDSFPVFIAKRQTV
ncbi:MAG TPA: glucose-1-phosphate adenylyltransferase subunit GlgD [Candidatus Anaerobutyricum faecale]|uniref:glucose-1-phosphate adenylyltransferase subunit GlgD n=1 Tax=Eubacterium sp. An11 TaxID=1965542 RepID=UPI000B397DBC|nr:glucose-1-phosphate adenylyltransferase subunit GlgD [Eubacterium sp. An11]OUQ65642.1 glucose-1-phosphate adenylyltransferase subunit GlgD [Eubacterium sp. An11]HJC31170.1 glucose-1-phosphate adenylyltransferase subunit GlgD [Candidatus Anaerobutyricum faecale]